MMAAATHHGKYMMKIRVGHGDCLYLMLRLRQIDLNVAASNFAASIV